jgi:D-amino peptidase
VPPTVSRGVDDSYNSPSPEAVGVTNVFISADIEGVTGYVDPEEDADPQAQAAMTADVNAAIDGVREADASASITVADAHGDKRTIDVDALHERATLVRGGPRPDGMVDGATTDDDVAFLVGYHDRPGSGGLLEHNFTGSIAEIRVDDRAVGELELNAAYLASMGVPVGLVTGDDVLAETVADALPSARYVRTKTTRGASAAETRHPGPVREDIREAATAAVADRPREPDDAIALDPPVLVVVAFVTAKHADVATLWPGVERGQDSRTVRYDAPDVQTAYRFCRAATTVSP